jgi:hypothetical protein
VSRKAVLEKYVSELHPPGMLLAGGRRWPTE